MPADQRSGRRRALRAVIVAGFYVGLTLVFFKPTVLDGATFSTVGAVQRVYFPWQVTHENGRPFFPQSDQAQSFYPRQVFVDRALEAGELPAWDPYTFAGHPYLSNGGNSFFYPPRQAVTWATGPALAHDLYLMLHMSAAGCTAYLLLRELRMSTGASLLGGVAWMWNPFFMSWAQLELLPPVVALLPLTLALAHRGDERRSWRARVGAGLVCGMMLLGSSLDLAMAACGVVGVYAVALAGRRLWQERRGAVWQDVARSVLQVATIPAVAVGIGAPALVPFALLSQRFARSPLDYETFTTGVTVPLETFARFWWRPDFPFTDVTMHRMAFVGTPIAILAVIGVLQRRPGTGLARGMLLGSVLVLGRTPLVAVLDALSEGYRFLSLGRFMFAWALGLVILAAAGLDRLLAWCLGRPVLDDGRPIQLPAPRQPMRSDARRLIALAAVAVLVAGTAVQLFRYDRAINADFIPRDRAWLFPETPAIEALLARRDGPAADRNLPILRRGLQPLPDSSIPLVFPFESAAGYDSALPRTIANLWRVVGGEDLDVVRARGLPSGLVALFYTDQTRFDLLARLAITSVLAPPDLEDEPGWDERGRAERGLVTVHDGPDADLLEVVDPAPRAYVVHDVEWVADEDEALGRFTDPSFPWRSTVILEGPEQPDDSPGAVTGLTPADIVAHGLTDVTVEVRAPAPGHLVLLDSYDEGWTVTVDGEPAELRRANAAFRAVEVPAGSSTVRFRYATPGLSIGVAMAILTLVVISGALVLERVRLSRRRVSGG